MAEYNCISKEELEKVLTRAGVFKGWIKSDQYDFSRTADCEALGMKFEIEWWCNLCNLYIGNAQIIFRWVYEDTTWPGYNWKRELFFANGPRPGPFEIKDDLVALIPTEWRMPPEEEGRESLGRES